MVPHVLVLGFERPLSACFAGGEHGLVADSAHGDEENLR